MSLGRCLILGGSGFIGSHLAELLVAEDFEVRILSRSAGSSSRLVAVAARVELLEGDYRDTQRLANAIRGCDYVYHLIATTVPAISNRDVVSDTDTNLIPTLRLLENLRSGERTTDCLLLFWRHSVWEDRKSADCGDSLDRTTIFLWDR